MIITQMDKQSLDIVKLIEKNPITRLDKDYNNKLLLKIKESFTEPEQQLFVSSFICYLNYNQKKDFVINLDGIWKWLGFSRKGHCKTLLEKHFIKDVDYQLHRSVERKNEGGATFDERNIEAKHYRKAASAVAEAAFEEKNEDGAGCFTEVEVKPNIGGAGLNKETIMLNINCFKKLCLKANTKKADEIHNYFIKLEDTIFDTVNEQTDELRLQTDELRLQIIDVKKVSMLHKQNLILKQYEYESVLYIIIVKTLEGVYIIKVGHSYGNFTRRWNDHNKKYPECILLDVFPVKMAHKFETFVHRELKHWRYKLLPGCEKEQELFQIGKGIQYNDVLDIINKNIKRFNDPNIIIKELELENQQLKEKLLTLGYDCENEKVVVEENEKVVVEENVEVVVEENVEVVVEENVDAVEVEELKTLDEINEIKRRKQNSERQKKYRQSDKYKLKIQTPEFIAKERERNNIRTKSEKFKQTCKEYYDNNKAVINEKKKKYNKKDSKKEKALTVDEKEKYLNWCKEHIILQENSNLIFKNFIGEYIETSNMILTIYKEYTQEFIKNEFPNIDDKLKRYKIDKESFYGWKGLCYK